MADRVIRLDPAAPEARPGQRTSVRFGRIAGPGVGYDVRSPDYEASSWCSVLVPVAARRPGRLIIDVPAGARPGRYPLRLTASVSDVVIAAGDLTLHVPGRTCFKLTARPKLALQPDGTLVMTLRLLNCGPFDAQLVLRARHEDGWSFSIDEPELILGTGRDPVSVKVTLRAPIGREAHGGDHVDVEVEAGGRTVKRPTRVPRPRWPWAVGSVAALLLAAALLWFLGPDPDDEVIPAPTTTTTIVPGPATTDPPPPTEPEVADLEAEPGQVDFGEVTIGDTVEESVTIVNVGDATADADPQVDGDDAITASPDCSEIAAGEQCQVVITFTPDTDGPFEATITVADAVITVTGEGIESPPIVD